MLMFPCFSNVYLLFWDIVCISTINLSQVISKNVLRGLMHNLFRYRYIQVVRDKKLQGFSWRTFNTMSIMILPMQNCIEKVVPVKWNETHFLVILSLFTIWPIYGQSESFIIILSLVSQKKCTGNNTIEYDNTY